MNHLVLDRHIIATKELNRFTTRMLKLANVVNDAVNANFRHGRIVPGHFGRGLSVPWSLSRMERPADLQHFGFSLLKISCAVNYEFLVYVYAMVAVLNLLGQDAAQGRDVVWAGLVHGGGLGRFQATGALY